MALYFKDVEITNIDNLVPQSGLDITDVWFGSTNVYTVWQTYEGTLPATLNANGDDMRQYQIWGNGGGVGDRTINLFDLSTITPGKYINAQGTEVNSPSPVEDSMLNHSDFISIFENTDYVFYHTGQPLSANSQNVALCWFDNQKNILSRILKAIPMRTASYSISGASPAGSAFAIVNFAGYTFANPGKNYFAPGTTPPETYVPFGYEVDMSVKSGNVYNTAETAWSADNTILDDDGNPIASSSHYTTNFTAVKPETSYYLSGTYRTNSISSIRIYFYDESKCWISRSAKIDIGATRAFMTPANCEFIQIQIDTNIRSTADWYIKEGTTPPDEYQPYINTTTPIYIGSDPLDKAEYIDYQAEKVYRKSANMFDKAATDTADGYIANRYVQSDGSIIISNNYNISEYITVEPLKEYTLENVAGNLPAICEYNENFDYISGENYKTRSKVTIKTSASAKYIRFSIFKENLNTIEMFTLTPTDPPVPLPALPTCEGETIVAYAGSGTAPEKVLLKYRKENF